MQNKKHIFSCNSIQRKIVSMPLLNSSSRRLLKKINIGRKKYNKLEHKGNKKFSKLNVTGKQKYKMK